MLPSLDSFVDELSQIEREKNAGLGQSLARAGSWLKNQYGHLGVAAGQAMMENKSISPLSGQSTLPLFGTAKNFLGAKLKPPTKPPGAVVSKVQKVLSAKPFKVGLDLLDQAGEFAKLAQVKPYQQKTQYSCSAACLKAVLEHWGADRFAEHEIMRAIGVEQKGGAEVDQITQAAQELGFDAYDKSFESLDEAKKVTDQDIPIIADLQSFNNPGAGHYVVITAIDDNIVHLMDPNTDGNERVITRAEMERRWWDKRMKAPHEMMPKWGIVVTPRS